MQVSKMTSSTQSESKKLPAILEIEKSRYSVIMQNGSLQRIDGPSSLIFEIEIFNGRALQRHALQYFANFCGDWSYRCRAIAKFPRNVFSSEMQKNQ